MAVSDEKKAKQNEKTAKNLNLDGATGGTVSG